MLLYNTFIYYWKWKSENEANTAWWQLLETLLGVLKRVHLTSADVANFDLDVVRSLSFMGYVINVKSVV